jgi:hypothetical protein
LTIIIIIFNNKKINTKLLLMPDFIKQPKENKNQSITTDSSQQTSSDNSFVEDKSPEAIQTQQLQAHIDSSIQEPLTDISTEAQESAQLQENADSFSKQETNDTGIPNEIKSGIEQLSGVSLDGVKVYYNSDKPAEIGADAYADGTNVYIAKGKEAYLPHELWHIVQQKDGKVKPTIKTEDNLKVNDDNSLENEADVMGAKATNVDKSKTDLPRLKENNIPSNSGIVQGKWSRVSAELAMQEAAEINSVNKLASQGDFINAFKLHISTEPAVATKFHKIWLPLIKNETLLDIVKEILKTTFDGGEIDSAEVLQSIIEHLPLDQEGSVDGFSKKITDLDISEATDDEKMDALYKVIAGKFEALEIPPPKIEILDGSGGRSGEFDSTTWSFRITSEKLALPVSEWASTAYHESRHAEQFFMIARLITQEGIVPPHSKQIPDQILSQAGRMPALKGVEKEKAEVFHKSIFGADSQKRQSTLSKLGLHTIAKIGETLALWQDSKADTVNKRKICSDYADLNKQNTLDSDQKWPDPTQTQNMIHYKLSKEVEEIRRVGFVSASEKQKESYEEYVNLPEEKEAHKLGDLVKAAITQINSLDQDL